MGSDIYASDNLPYADQPFGIPDSWEWAGLGDLFEISTGPFGSMLHKSDYVADGVPIINPKDIVGRKIIADKRISVEMAKKLETYKLSVGDIVIARRGEMGRCAALTNDEDGWICGTGCFIIRNNLHVFDTWLTWLLSSPYAVSFLVGSSIGTTMNNLNHGILNSFFVPLPSLAEQHRIVERIEELRPHITAYDTAEKKLTTLNTTFPDALKKSILQAAVQGKLVPQDPNDEPASVLLEKIRAEKEALIKAGKIKRDKHESVIFRRDNSHYTIRDGIEVCIDEELPFEIPDSWEWVCLNSICEYIQRGKSPKYSPIKKYPVIAQKCNQWSGFSIEKAQFIEPESLPSYARERLLIDDDLLWNSTGLGTLGRMAVYKTALNPYELAIADSHVTVIRPMKNYVLSAYLYAYFSNPSVQLVIESQSDGTTKQKELATSTIKCYYVPLPPRQEQLRIIAQIEQAVDMLKKLPTP